MKGLALRLFLWAIPLPALAGNDYVPPPDAAKVSGVLAVANGGTAQSTGTASGLAYFDPAGNKISYLPPIGACGFVLGPSPSTGSFSSNASINLTCPGNVPTVGVASTSGTLQGNAFNGASQLVQLNGSSQLPAVSAALLTNVQAGALTAGPLASSILPSTAAFTSVNQAWSAPQIWNSSGTVAANFGVSGANSLSVGTLSPATKIHMSSGTLTIDGNVQDSILAAGDIGLPVLTQATINARTPTRRGELIFNTTKTTVCVSTGTTVMGYADMANGGTCL